MVACRIGSDPQTSDATYQRYNLADKGVRSTQAADLQGYNGRLFIAWTDNTDNKIRYKRCEGDTSIPSNSQTSPFTTSDVPVMAVYQGVLYLAFLGMTPDDDGLYPVNVATYTQTGAKFTWSGATNVTTSYYTPCFSVYGDQLYLFTIGPSGLQYKILKSGTDFDPAKTLAAGPWATAKGISVAYRGDRQWLFVNDGENNVYVKEWTAPTWLNLSGTNADVRSLDPVGVTLIPGIPSNPNVLWRVYLVWRDSLVRDTKVRPFVNEKSLRECFLEV